MVPTFVALYETSYLQMVRLAHLLTGSNEAGEEVVQDAFAQAFKRFDQLDNPGAYVRRSVVNGCHSWHRRRGSEHRALQRSAPRVEVQHSVANELGDALDALPFRQRAALVLRFYEDRSTEGIAEALGCRPGTAKSLVSRGLQQLREVIER
jgi:RNA polymerase sigma-70 factor (sigma-E family)